jgi:hypothetical protein
MKIAVIFAALALLLRCSIANAGGVQIGLLNEDQIEKWECGAAMPGQESQSKSSCGIAKYREGSSCPTVVVTNDSSETVKVLLQVTGYGFAQLPNGVGGGGSFGFFSYRGDKCDQRTVDRSCESLAPGHSCSAEIEFSPEQSGSSDGHIEVLATGSGKPVSKAYDLVASADYPPDLLEIDEVIKRRRAELMRIPHVVRVSIGDFDDGVIQVEVAHEEDIPRVERDVPPKLEGYRVEVIEEIARGWGY